MAEQTRSPHWDRMREKAYEILNVRAEVTRRQTRAAAAVEGVGRLLAYPLFFLVLLAAHGLWIVLNLPVFPWFEPWDPYPFMFLATVASAEAPFIALMVLMYQRRSSRISELREEVELQVSLQLERQMTVTLRLLEEVQRRLAIESREDPELLAHLQKELDPKLLMQSLRRELREQEDGETATAP